MFSITGISGWITAWQPPTARTVSSANGSSSPTCTARHGSAQLRRRLRIGVQLGSRVVLEQGRQPRDVYVIGVLVGDQDRGQTGDSLEAVRESTGIEEQAGLTELSEEAGMAEMRELHVYDCALMGAFPMRLILATMLVAGRLLATLMAAPSAQAEPETCPPICDQIPATAWISTHAGRELAIPLAGNAGAAVAVPGRHHVSGSSRCAPRRRSRTTAAIGRSRAGSRWSTPTASGSCRLRCCTGAGTPPAVARSRRRCLAPPSPRYAPASWAHRCSRRRSPTTNRPGWPR
ncbi:hypothetical protein J113_05540 [Mycobacterium tuberculosis CAS/NITR204]|uniref:Uncharacterized protein n=1 Tax=Mycobacterium tuberculosis CAS/NITR204 TaxID=1310114 RepID=R4M3Q1_MYCTX|nr:hypothetical protein J113_05540 [Mycobacterium tuberculosis CAS/NITR204]